MYSLYKNKYRIFILVETTIRKGLKQKRENRGDEANWAIIHIYTEMSQGHSLCSYLKQAKISFVFSFIKSENSTVEEILPGRGGCYKWEGRGDREEV
jgi:hypothetical protein